MFAFYYVNAKSNLLILFNNLSKFEYNVLKMPLKACVFITQKERFPSTVALTTVEQSLRHSARSWSHFPAQRTSPQFIIVRGWPSLLNNVRETHTLEMIPKSMILIPSHSAITTNQIEQTSVCGICMTSQCNRALWWLNKKRS